MIKKTIEIKTIMDDGYPPKGQFVLFWVDMEDRAILGSFNYTWMSEYGEEYMDEEILGYFEYQDILISKLDFAKK